MAPPCFNSDLFAGVRDLNANEPMATIGMAARFPGCHGNGSNENLGTTFGLVGTVGRRKPLGFAWEIWEAQLENLIFEVPSGYLT